MFEQSLNFIQILNNVWTEYEFDFWSNSIHCPLNKVWTKYEFEIIGWTKFEHNVNMALLTALDWNKLWTKFALQIWPWKRQNKDWTYYEWSLNFNELIWTMYEQSLNWNIVWTLFEQSLNRVWTNHEFYVQTLFKPTLVRSTRSDMICPTRLAKLSWNCIMYWNVQVTSPSRGRCPGKCRPERSPRTFCGVRGTSSACPWPRARRTDPANGPMYRSKYSQIRFMVPPTAVLSNNNRVNKRIEPLTDQFF